MLHPLRRGREDPIYHWLDAVLLADVKRSGYSQVDLIDPGSIERIQVQRRTRTVAARNPGRGVIRRLIQGAVIESVSCRCCYLRLYKRHSTSRPNHPSWLQVIEPRRMYGMGFNVWVFPI